MIISFCIDDRGGMTFNGKRVSRDKNLCERLVFKAKSLEAKLFVSSYSAKLFNISDIVISENFPENDENIICFIENTDIEDYLKIADKLIIYKWNRIYPFDRKLDSKLLDNFVLTEKYDFKGFSHEKITEETYERKIQNENA